MTKRTEVGEKYNTTKIWSQRLLQTITHTRKRSSRKEITVKCNKINVWASVVVAHDYPSAQNILTDINLKSLMSFYKIENAAHSFCKVLISHKEENTSLQFSTLVPWSPSVTLTLIRTHLQGSIYYLLACLRTRKIHSAGEAILRMDGAVTSRETHINTQVSRVFRS